MSAAAAAACDLHQLLQIQPIGGGEKPECQLLYVRLLNPAFSSPPVIHHLSAQSCDASIASNKLSQVGHALLHKIRKTQRRKHSSGKSLLSLFQFVLYKHSIKLMFYSIQDLDRSFLFYFFFLQLQHDVTAWVQSHAPHWEPGLVPASATRCPGPAGTAPLPLCSPHGGVNPAPEVESRIT